MHFKSMLVSLAATAGIMAATIGVADVASARPLPQHYGTGHEETCEGASATFAGFPDGDHTVTVTASTPAGVIGSVDKTFTGGSGKIKTAWSDLNIDPKQGTALLQIQYTWTADGGGTYGPFVTSHTPCVPPLKGWTSNATCTSNRTATVDIDVEGLVGDGYVTFERGDNSYNAGDTDVPQTVHNGHNTVGIQSLFQDQTWNEVIRFRVGLWDNTRSGLVNDSQEAIIEIDFRLCQPAPTTSSTTTSTTVPPTTSTTLPPTTSTTVPTTEPTTTAPTTAPAKPTIFVEFDCRGFTIRNNNEVELSVNVEFDNNEPNKLVVVPPHGSVNVPLEVDVHALVRPVGDVAVFGKAEATGLDCQVTPTVVEQEPPTLPPTASPSLPATGRDPSPIALFASVTMVLGIILLVVRRRKVTFVEGVGR